MIPETYLAYTEIFVALRNVSEQQLFLSVIKLHFSLNLDNSR